MKEYKCIEIERYPCETEEELNKLAKDGWVLVCSYAKHGYFLILERNKKVCGKCGR